MFPKTCGFEGICEVSRHRSMLTEDRLNALYHVGLYCSNLDGDFVELGCHCGGTSFLLSSLLKLDHQLHAFDSFEGLPELTEEDGGHHSKGQLKADYDTVRNYLPDRVKLYKGWVEDTLINIKDKPLSLIYIDMDLYAPTKFAITNLWNQLVKGGYMIFDDYLWGATPGIKQVVDEFFPNIFRHNHYFVHPQLGIQK
jgi:O-methyltransferase